MSFDSPIPAAQYLRKSTEHQQYSLENQQDAIRSYAIDHGFNIVETYSDPGRSGLTLRQRPGLRRLLRDIETGTIAYKAILVYDVSRWGRFQDADESAHHEFLCKHAGIPVHYCAEMFPNDGTLPSSIFKALKRTMAAEYSRELGIDLSSARPRRLTDDLARTASVLVTMGCGDACPFIPGLRTLDWPLPDPKGQSRDAVRAIRDAIHEKVNDLLKSECVDCVKARAVAGEGSKS